MIYKVSLTSTAIQARNVVIKACPNNLLSFFHDASNIDIYRGIPFARMSPKRRGDILEQWARSMDTTASDALITSNFCGRRRSKCQTEYDFLSGENTRVEIKSSRLNWSLNNHFYLKFHNIKTTNDEIRLVSYTPHGLYLHCWNGSFIGNNGGPENPLGSFIQISGPRHVTDWNEALSKMLHKNFGILLNFVSWSNIDKKFLLLDNPVNDIFKNSLLPQMDPQRRGEIFERWVRSFDENTRDPELLTCFDNVRKRCLQTASHDYVRDGVRVEVKSAQMVFEKCSHRWHFLFQNFHENNCDEVRLVFYTPGGAYVFLYDGRCGLTTIGKVTSATGAKSIAFYGPRRVEDWRASWRDILKKDFGTLLIECNF